MSSNLENKMADNGFIEIPAIAKREHTLEELYTQRDKFDKLYSKFRKRHNEPHIKNLLRFYETHIYLLDELIYQRENK